MPKLWLRWDWTLQAAHSFSKSAPITLQTSGRNNWLLRRHLSQRHYFGNCRVLVVPANQDAPRLRSPRVINPKWSRLTLSGFRCSREEVWEGMSANMMVINPWFNFSGRLWVCTEVSSCLRCQQAACLLRCWGSSSEGRREGGEREREREREREGERFQHRSCPRLLEKSLFLPRVKLLPTVNFLCGTVRGRNNKLLCHPSLRGASKGAHTSFEQSLAMLDGRAWGRKDKVRTAALSLFKVSPRRACVAFLYCSLKCYITNWTLACGTLCCF